MAIAQIISPTVETAKLVSVELEVTFANGSKETVHTTVDDARLDVGIKAFLNNKFVRYSGYKLIDTTPAKVPTRNAGNLNVINMHVKKLKGYAQALQPISFGDEAGYKITITSLKDECEKILSELNKL